MKLTLPAPALALALALGCTPEKPAAPHPPATALVTMQGGRIVAPDSLPAGPVRFRLARTDSVGHNLVVFAIPPQVDPESFAKSLDTAPGTPAPGVARGGPEVPAAPGDTGDVYLTLEPGRYLLGCMVRGFAETRHVAAGEWRLLVVTPSTAEAAPAATIELGLADFAFQSEEEWPAGDQVIKVSNIGKQEHIVFLQRLDAGHAMKDWLAVRGDAEWSHSLGGVSRLGPGQTVLLPRRLLPGRYILVCLFIDPASGRPHLELGMLREVIVGNAT